MRNSWLAWAAPVAPEERWSHGGICGDFSADGFSLVLTQFIQEGKKRGGKAIAIFDFLHNLPQHL